MQINLIFDTQAQGAPQSFRDAVQAAANIIAAAFTDNVTVNIAVGYGENGGTPVTGGGATGGPSGGIFENYSTLVGQLAAQDSGDVLSGVNALPSGSSIQGQSQVAVWSAEEKVLGLLSPTNSAVDGSVGFATDVPTSSLVAVALHEIAHALGRVPNGPQPDIFDLFRFANSGGLLFSGDTPAAAAYFSLDGGKTDLADYGTNNDPSDYLNGGVGPTNDAFDEFYNSNTLSFLTRTDILQMEALGFHALAHPVGDYLGQGASDIVWLNTNGQLGLWDSTVGVGANTSEQILGAIPSGWQIQQIADINGDGKADFVWRNTNGDVGLWNSVSGAGSVGFTFQDFGVVPLSWQIAGSGDFSGSGPDQLLWRNTNGDVGLWTPTTSTAGAVSFIYSDLGVIDTSWQIAGVGDFSNDGKTDVLWRNTSNGDVGVWNSVPGAGSVSFTDQDLGVVPTNWQIQGVGDFNGDGKADILWRNTTSGDVELWKSVPGGGVSFTGQDLGVIPLNWHIQEVGDFNGDGKADILWRDSNTGDVELWSASVSGSTVFFPGHDFGVVSTTWQIQSDWHGT